MNCTGCLALRLPVRGGVCALGISTGTSKKNGQRVRHPLATCRKPKSDAELTERLEIIARERR